jgi:hypothetical protein
MSPDLKFLNTITAKFRGTFKSTIPVEGVGFPTGSDDDDG